MPTLVKISEGAISTSGLFSETSDLLFEIHPPQRRFKWKQQQIDQLCQDIITAYKANRDSYFLGTLLLAGCGKTLLSTQGRKLSDDKRRPIACSERIIRIGLSHAECRRDS